MFAATDPAIVTAINVPVESSQCFLTVGSVGVAERPLTTVSVEDVLEVTIGFTVEDVGRYMALVEDVSVMEKRVNEFGKVVVCALLVLE